MTTFHCLLHQNNPKTQQYNGFYTLSALKSPKLVIFWNWSFFICFQNTSISLVLFLIFLVSFGRRSQKKEFGYWNISILWDFCQGYLVKIAFFGIFFLIPRYSTGFWSIQHLFLKIQVILPRFRGGEVQANHKKRHFLCVKVVILGVWKMA